MRIVFVGARFLVAPRAAAAGFGITATPGDRNAGATACGVHGATAAVPLVTAALLLA